VLTRRDQVGLVALIVILLLSFVLSITLWRRGGRKAGKILIVMGILVPAVMFLFANHPTHGSFVERRILLIQRPSSMVLKDIVVDRNTYITFKIPLGIGMCMIAAGSIILLCTKGEPHAWGAMATLNAA
jgi:hypothetical protein